jgi:hypothetical protein
MPTKDRSWFERKVRELGDVLRRRPRRRRTALRKALERDCPEPRQGTGGSPDAEQGENQAVRRAQPDGKQNRRPS